MGVDDPPAHQHALHHNEVVTHEYLMWAMCAGDLLLA